MSMTAVIEQKPTALGVNLPEGISQVIETNGVATVDYDLTRAEEVERDLISIACSNGLIPFKIDLTEEADTQNVARMSLVPCGAFGIDFVPTGTLEELEEMPDTRNQIVAFPTSLAHGSISDLEVSRTLLVRHKYGEVGFIRSGSDPYLDRSELSGNQMPMLVIRRRNGVVQLKASQRLVFPYAAAETEPIVTESIIPSRNGGHKELIGKEKKGYCMPGELPWRAYLDSQLSSFSEGLLDESFELMEVTQAANENGRDNRTLVQLIGLLYPLIEFFSTPEGFRILKESNRIPSIALAARTGIMGELAKSLPTTSEFGSDFPVREGNKTSALAVSLRETLKDRPFTIQLALIGSPAYDLYSEYEDSMESDDITYGEKQLVHGRVFPCLIRFIPKPE